MKIIENPRIDTWKEILQRPAIETGALFGTVSKVLDDVHLNGDEALRRYELEFDHVSLEKLNVEDDEFYEAVNYIPDFLCPIKKSKIVFEKMATKKKRMFQSKEMPVQVTVTLDGSLEIQGTPVNPAEVEIKVTKNGFKLKER